MSKYLRNFGLALDKLLNAATGGDADETVSERAAMAQIDGKRWGCALCRWLHYTVESNHCAKTLDPKTPTKNAAGIKALVQMILLVWCVVHIYAWWVYG